MRPNGFTLVEVLVSMSVLAIIAGVEVVLLQAGSESWSHASHRIVLQRSADDLIGNIFEGGYGGEGIRDAVEIRGGGLNYIEFVPLWTDHSHHPDAVRNKDQQFILEKQFKPGAQTPIGQIRRADSKDYVTVPIKFFYGNGRDPKAPDDQVEFLDPIPSGAQMKLLYTPDAEVDTSVIKIFRWDPSSKKVFESYMDKTREVLQHEDNISVERCAFLYFDNLNRLIPLSSGEALSPLSIKRVTAVKLYIMLKNGDELKEVTSFTSIRNVTTVGATISEGSELPLPTHNKIKAFSISDFYGLKKNGIVELLVHTKTNKRWKVRMVFRKGEKEGDLILERFQMESPPGKILTSAVLNQPTVHGEFVSILSLDRTGLYDYGKDEGASGEINISGGSPTVTVTRLDFEGASLFLRP